MLFFLPQTFMNYFFFAQRCHFVDIKQSAEGIFRVSKGYEGRKSLTSHAEGRASPSDFSRCLPHNAKRTPPRHTMSYYDCPQDSKNVAPSLHAHGIRAQRYTLLIYKEADDCVREGADKPRESRRKAHCATSRKPFAKAQNWPFGTIFALLCAGMKNNL